MYGSTRDRNLSHAFARFFFAQPIIYLRLERGEKEKEWR